MYDTIQQVINDAIANTPAAGYARQYSGTVDKVAADVATHVSKCSEDLLGKADDLGIDEDDLRAALVEVGLAVEREPEVMPESTGDASIDARFERIESTLQRLSAIAERAEQYLR